MTQNRLKIENAVMLLMSTHAWGNRKKADIQKIETVADKKFLSVSKKLIDSEAYRKITSLQNNSYEWIKNQSVPAFVVRGAYLFNQNMVEEVEEYLKSKNEELFNKIEDLVAEYQLKIIEAETLLGDQFNVNDYPEIEEIRQAFWYEWKWVVFDIPEGLPQKVFEAEKAKAENMWKESAEQISQSLRQAFAKLINHANQMLVPGEDGKNKRFKNSSFDAIDEFIATFKNRNIVNDTDLENLVNQAKAVLNGIEDPQQLKKDEDLRDMINYNFNEIEKALDTMIETKPGRKFNL